MVAFAHEMRHRCRKCKGNLPAPVSAENHAFCTRFCYEQFYRKHCTVCQCDLALGPANRKTCKKASCRTAYRNRPDVYDWPKIRPSATHTAEDASDPQEKPDFIEPFWCGKSGRGWEWRRLRGDDEDWDCYDRWGTLVAKIRHDIRDGRDEWWMALPRCIPEQSWADLGEAKRRVAELAVMARPLWRSRPEALRKYTPVISSIEQANT